MTFEYDLPSYHIRLLSAGNHLGNDSVVIINGASLSPGKRGFNVVVLKMDDGSVMRYSFDTYLHDNPVAGCE